MKKKSLFTYLLLIYLSMTSTPALSYKRNKVYCITNPFGHVDWSIYDSKSQRTYPAWHVEYIVELVGHLALPREAAVGHRLVRPACDLAVRAALSDRALAETHLHGGCLYDVGVNATTAGWGLRQLKYAKSFEVTICRVWFQGKTFHRTVKKMTRKSRAEDTWESLWSYVISN